MVLLKLGCCCCCWYLVFAPGGRLGAPWESGGERSEVAVAWWRSCVGVEGAWIGAVLLEVRMGSSSSERSGVDVSCMRESPSGGG